MTAEQACINYAVAAHTIHELTQELWAHRCPDKSLGAPPTPSCLETYFAGPPDNEGKPLPDPKDALCEDCFAAFGIIQQRKLARRKFSVVKRAVLAVGKRLNATPLLSPVPNQEAVGAN